MNLGELVVFGDVPCCRAVGDEGVGEEDDGCHVLHGNASGFKGHGEAVGGRGGGKHGNGAFAVAAVEGLCQVGLFGLGGQTCGGAAALNVDDYQRQLHDYGQANAFALQRQTGT